MPSMLRLAAGAVVILTAGAALAQPPAEYFPAKKGSKWVYKVGDQEVTVEAVGEEMLGGDKCQKFVTKIGAQEKASELYAIKDDGVYRVKVKDDEIKPTGVKVIPGKFEKDATWKVDCNVGNQKIAGNFKVVGVNEKVKVGMAEYDAVVVEGKDLDIAGTKTTVKQWYAKGVGLVKAEYSVQNAAQTMELKEFKKGE